MLLAGAVAPHPAGAQSQRAELEQRIRRDTLANGLEVIVVENHGVPLATVEVDVRNGSFTQPPAYEGLSHLYEHMIFAANAKYPRVGEFMGRLYDLGADYNGRTTEENVSYYLTLSADSLRGGMEALSAALESPLFRPEELQREREVVIGEYDRNEAQPFYFLNTAMGKALWGTAWSRKNPLGVRQVILAATPEQMHFIQRKYYVPNNSALIVTGDVQADSVFALARRTFGDWKRAPDPFVADPIPPMPPLVRDTAVIVEQPVGAVMLMLQWQGPSARGDVPATYAADVFSDVLNQPGSKFQKRLVDSGLFQGVTVNYYTLNQVGPITISGITTPDKLREARVALEQEIGRVTQPGYITQAELDAVKRHRITDTKFQMERASGFAHQLGFWWSVTGLDYYLGYVDAMARQTPADLRGYASRYIVGKPHVTGVLISPDARRQISLTLADLTGAPAPGARQ